jgi:hypothetical protein
VKSKAKSILIIAFGIKGIVNKEFVLAGQPIDSAYYCDVLRWLCENVPRLRPELCRRKNWLLHHNNASYHTSFISRELSTKSNMTVVPHPYFSLFPLLKIKRKGHFDTIEVIEVQSLNTLTEHDL